MSKVWKEGLIEIWRANERTIAMTTTEEEGLFTFATQDFIIVSTRLVKKARVLFGKKKKTKQKKKERRKKKE